MRVAGRIMVFLSFLAENEDSCAQKSIPLPHLSSQQQIFRNVTARASFATIPLGDTIMAYQKVQTYLYQQLKTLHHPAVSLRLSHRIESPGGLHLTYHQLYNGLPIWLAEIKVNLDRAGNIRSVFDNSFNTENWSILRTEITTFVLHSPLLAQQFVKRYFSGAFIVSEPVIFFDGTKPLLASNIKIHLPGTHHHYNAIVDEQGTLLLLRDLNVYASRQDSTVSALIFLPDPLTTAGVTYGTPYIDNNDEDIPELNVQRTMVNIPVTFRNNTFFLESSYVVIAEFSDPIVPPATSLVPEFYFTRSQSGFEDINVYYHVYAFQEYLQSIGFFNLANDSPIWVDTHGLTGMDNSMFSPFPTPRLIFGEGGVDDAEDADVIIHEYGHAISHSAAPGTNIGTEREALDEGLGDYLAASYSRSLNAFSWEKVFTWDGHNEFWSGRNALTSKTYPDGITSDIHLDGEIWASTMMEVWEELGREATDRLMLQSVYSWAGNMTMPQAALLVLQADTLLFGGVNHHVLCEKFSARGLLSSSCKLPEPTSDTLPPRTEIIISNTKGFAEGAAVSILLPTGTTSTSLLLFDALGRLMYRAEQSSDEEILLEGDHLAAGLYLLRVTADSKQKTVKLAKIKSQ